MRVDVLCVAVEAAKGRADFAATDSQRNRKLWGGHLPRAGLHLGNLSTDDLAQFYEGGHYVLMLAPSVEISFEAEEA